MVNAAGDDDPEGKQKANKVLISDIQTEGNAIISKKELLSVIKIKRGDEYIQSRLMENQEAVVNYYKAKGFFKAEVEANVMQKRDLIRLLRFFRLKRVSGQRLQR